MADLLSTSIAGTLNVSQGTTISGDLNVSQGATITGNLFVSNTNIVPEFGKYSRVISNTSYDNILSWYATKQALSIGSTAGGVTQGVFVKPDGTQLYILENNTETVSQFRMTDTHNVASAVYEGNLNISTADIVATDLFFSNTGTILYILGDNGNAIDTYDLLTAWNVVAGTTGANNIVAGNTLPLFTAVWEGMYISPDGAFLYVTTDPTTSNDHIHQYNVAVPWNVATATLNAAVNLASFGLGGPSSLGMNKTGTQLYIVDNGTAVGDEYLYQFNLSQPFQIASATFASRTHLWSTFNETSGANPETTPSGFFFDADSNTAYYLGNNGDVVRTAKVAQGAVVNTSMIVNGKFTANNGLEVVKNSSTILGGGLYVQGGAIFYSSGTFTGNFTLSGSSFSYTGISATIGTSTANSTYTFGAGATLANRIKNVDIGTSGVAGSNTNITIGSNVAPSTTQINVFASSVTFSNTVNIASGPLLLSGYNVLDEIFVADNTAAVSANSGAILGNRRLNFVNTASVTVSVIDPGDGTTANISFTSSGTSGVASVNTGLGLTGGPITSTGTISANIASTTVQGITKLIDVVNSTDTGNAATGAAVKIAYDQATLAYTQANTGVNTAIAAYEQANVALNKGQVSANSGSIQTNVSLNFINTASILVSVLAGSTGNANVGFTAVAGSTTTAGILQLTDSIGSTSTTTAATPNSVKTAYDLASIAANQTSVSANSGSLITDASLNFVNTSTIQVSVTSGVSGNANVAFSSIISAGSVANTLTITPVRTGPHSHYAVTALNTAATINPPAINTGVDGDRLTLRILDSGTGRALTWNTSAGAYRAIGITLPTTTVASKTIYVGCIYNSQNNFWDAVAYVQQA